MSTDARDDRVEAALLILKRLTTALNTCRLYGAGHPRLRAALTDLAAPLTRYLGRHDALEMEIARGTWRFAFDGTERTNDQIAPLLAALHGRGVAGVRFGPETTEADLRELLALLVLPIDRVRAAGGPAAVLLGAGVEAVTLVEIRLSGDERPAGGGPRPAPAAAAAILRQFVAAARNTRLYGERHPIVGGAVDELFATLHAALGGGDLRYDVRAGSVFAANAPVEEDPLAGAAFAADCAARQIKSLTFAPGLTRAELAHAVALFARDPEALVVEGGFPEALRVRQVAHVR